MKISLNTDHAISDRKSDTPAPKERTIPAAPAVFASVHGHAQAGVIVVTGPPRSSMSAPG